MANVTIPNLPSATAATDLDILVIVDSGETTTSKITKADLLSGIGGKIVDGVGSNSLANVGREADATGSSSILINTNTGYTGNDVGNNSVSIGAHSVGQVEGVYNTYINSQNGGIAGTGADYNAIVGGENLAIISADHSVAIGGFQNRSDNRKSALIAGWYNDIGAGGEASGVFVGRANDIGTNSNKVTIIGGTSNQIGDNVVESSIVGGSSNSIANTTSYSAIVGGTSNTQTGNGTYSFIGGGSGNSNNSRESAMIGGLNNTINTSASFHTQNVIIGGQSNEITGSSFRSGIIGGDDNTLTNSSNSYIIGGSFQSTINNADRSFILGGATGSQIKDSDGSSILGGTRNDIDTTRSNNIIASSSDSDIRNSASGTILSSYLSTLLNGDGNIAIGDYRGVYDSNGNSSALDNYTDRAIGIGNEDVDIRFNGGVGSKGSVFSLGSVDSWIGSDSSTRGNIRGSGFINAHNSFIQSTGSQIENNYIIGSSNSAIADLNNITIWNIDNFTATTENTFYTQNIKTTGQISNGYYDNGSGSTFSVDFNNGNSQKLYMTGDTTIAFTGLTNGAQYRLQIVNGGSFNITGVTATGYTILCEGGTIPNITNSGVDLCVIEVMDTDILVRHFANFSTP